MCMFCKRHFQWIGPTLKAKGSEHCHWVTSTPASWFGGPGFKSQPRYWLFCLNFFIGFPQSLQADARIMPQISHDHFSPHPSSLLCRKGPSIQLFVAGSIDSIVKRTIKNKWNECKKEISVIYTHMLHCDLFLVTQSDGQIQEQNKKM
jgi:hypothetical protein